MADTTFQSVLPALKAVDLGDGTYGMAVNFAQPITLTNPTINGTIATTGLTMPAFTLGGTVTISGQQFSGVAVFGGHIGLITSSATGYGINYVETYVLADNLNRMGSMWNIKAGKTTAPYTARMSGIYTQPEITNANTQNWTNALGLVGFNTYLYSGATSSGTITAMAGLNVEGAVPDAATVTNWYGVYLANPTVTNNKLTNLYGVYIAAMTGGATLNYAIYAAGGNNYLNGDSVFGAHYIQQTEMTAPGAGEANTVRTYAVVGGDTLTDYSCVFQDGTIVVIAEESTPLDSPIFTQPSGVTVTRKMVKPHPGLIQFVEEYSTGERFVTKSIEYHDAEKIAANKGCDSSVLPAGWEVTTLQQRIDKWVAHYDSEIAQIETNKEKAQAGITQLVAEIESLVSMTEIVKGDELVEIHENLFNLEIQSEDAELHIASFAQSLVDLNTKKQLELERSH